MRNESPVDPPLFGRRVNHFGESVGKLNHLKRITKAESRKESSRASCCELSASTHKVDRRYGHRGGNARLYLAWRCEVDGPAL